MNSIYKTCSKCKKTKPVSEFHRQRQSYRSKCKECRSKRDGGYLKPAPRGYKRCTQCRKAYPATTEFFQQRTMCADGLQPSCKNCTWEKRNPNKHNQKQRRWRKSNPEAVRKIKHRYYKNNPAQKIKESRLGRSRQRKRMRNDWKFAKSVRDYARRWTSNRRAKEKNLPATFTDNCQRQCLEYFDGCCAVCGRPPGLLHTIALDHWIPISSPSCPGTTPGNMIPLCHGVYGCNNSKGGKLPDDWLIEKFGKRKANQILKRVNTYFEQVG